MLSLTVQIVWIVYAFLPNISSQPPFTKSIHLTPNTVATIPGISLTTSSSVAVLANKWKINVKTQTGSDLHIKMDTDSQFTFHSLYPSTMSLIINGSTANKTYHDDGEVILLFSVNNSYFADIVSIDKRRSAYKQCPASNTPLITTNINAMITAALPQRYYRFCKNPVTANLHDPVTDYWTNHLPPYKNTANWPMYVSITNDPIANTLYYAWSDDINNVNKLSSFYTSSFNTNRAMNMYISGDNLNEQFTISDIHITYQYTAAPTTNPTKSPTINTLNPSTAPTLKPTSNPTATPTNPSANPTLYPTVTPTSNPTVNPTLKPTLNPSINPSISTVNPSFSPTFGPSLNPSKIPTVSPSFHPTISPTIEPTINPTVATANPTSPTINPTTPSSEPTMSPSNNPSYNPSNIPSEFPTVNPTKNPSLTPTKIPTRSPSFYPTATPTANPATTPTLKPTILPSNNPSYNPTPNPTATPTQYPSINPSASPFTTLSPTLYPTIKPTNYPSTIPTTSPSYKPTLNPTAKPTKMAKIKPTTPPSTNPFISTTPNPIVMIPSIDPSVSDVIITSSVHLQPTDNKNADNFLTTIKTVVTMPVIIVILIGSFALCSICIATVRKLRKSRSRKKEKIKEMKGESLYNTIKHIHESYHVHLSQKQLSDTDSLADKHIKHEYHVSHTNKSGTHKSIFFNENQLGNATDVSPNRSSRSVQSTGTTMTNEGYNKILHDTQVINMSESSVNSVSESSDGVPREENENMNKFIQLVADQRNSKYLNDDGIDEFIEMYGSE